MDRSAQIAKPVETAAPKKPWIEPECEPIDIARETAGPEPAPIFDGVAAFQLS